MRVVIAPDKFAGTLSARAAAEAMAAGWRRVRPDDEVVAIPTADGGAGTIDVVVEAVPEAVLHELEVADALGHARVGRWLELPDGRALIEAAEACGLAQLAPDRRDPRRTTSYGVGELMRAAEGAGANELVVTLGGSATNDGGAGMATGLGHRLLRADGNGLKVGGEYLVELDRVDLGPPLAPPVVAASDVTNPLLGSEGATTVFGPQKGAGPQDLPLLEQALRRLADVVERDLPGGPWRDLPGAGAAGGLGFALAAFCGARFVAGAPAVADLTGLAVALAGADVVLTGEGKLDAQTAHGKAPGWVAQRGRASGARVLAIAGRLADGAERTFDDARDLGPEGMERAEELVTEKAAELARSG